jgi:hypothetical protein
VPEQGLQPPVDARELRDREERGGDLGPARELAREAAVEHGEGGGGQDRPQHVDGQQVGLARVLPRADEVPGAEQLGADVVGDDHLAGDHAVEQQQADMIGARALEPRDVPHADAELVDAHDELPLRLLTARAGEQAAEVWVRVEEADGVGGGCLHHGLQRRFLYGSG